MCHGHISWFGMPDAKVETLFTVPIDTVVTCDCDAIYGEGDLLEILQLDESQCSGFGCVDGCQDCRGCPECFTAHDIQGYAPRYGRNYSDE
jgi:hypothetical protein